MWMDSDWSNSEVKRSLLFWKFSLERFSFRLKVGARRVLYWYWYLYKFVLHNSRFTSNEKRLETSRLNLETERGRQPLQKFGRSIRTVSVPQRAVLVSDFCGEYFPKECFCYYFKSI